jgi:hypothetical protein
MNEKTIYDLRLHERTTVGESLIVRRVPGGWLYEKRNRDSSMVFVSFNNDFQGAENCRAGRHDFEDYLGKPIGKCGRDGCNAINTEFKQRERDNDND